MYICNDNPKPMTKILFTIVLLSSTLMIRCQSTTNPKPKKQSMTKLNGEYTLQGIHDMAAGFRFTPDGKFEFFYIYGATDRNATGTYTVEGDTVKLHSDKEPGKDFKIDRQSKKGKGYTIQVTAPNEYLLRNILCFYFDGETPDATQTNSAETDSKGMIHLDVDAIDTIYLRHEIFPDIPSLIKDKANANNYFEVSLLPSLGQVSFKGIDLFIKGDTLTCHPNYFMPFDNIRFVK